MANINLISAKRQERVRFSRLARGMALGVLMMAAVGVAANAFQGMNWWITSSRLSELNTKLEDLRPVLAEIEACEAERRAIMPKLVTLTQAQTATKRWHGMMDGLKRAVPEQTWLTNISVDGSSAGEQRTRISGVTATQTRVGETMLRLNRQPEYYSKIDLVFAQANKDDDGGVEFELAAMLVPVAGVGDSKGQVNATQAN